MKQALRNKMHSFAPVLVAIAIIPFGLQNALIILTSFFYGSLLVLLYGRKDRFVASILLCGFLVRMLVAIIDDKIGILPYAWDDFYTAGLQIKNNIQNGYPIFDGIEKSIHLKSYSLFNALLLIIFGNYEICIRLFNCFLGALIAERVYKLAQLLHSNALILKLSLLLTAFWPSFILFNSLNMRDTLIVFLSIDMILRFLKINVQRKIVDILIIIIEILSLSVLRIQNIIVYIIVIACYIIFTKVFKKNIKNIFKPLPLIVIGSTFIIFLFASQYFDGLLRYMNIEKQWRAIGGSAYLVGHTYNSWFDVIRYAPIHFLHFCFGPFPWQIKNGFMLLAFCESIAFLAFFIITLYMIFREKSISFSPTVILLLLFAILGLLANSLIDSNYGTAIRHKMNYIVVFFIFASAFIHDRQLKIL